MCGIGRTEGGNRACPGQNAGDVSTCERRQVFACIPAAKPFATDKKRDGQKDAAGHPRRRPQKSGLDGIAHQEERAERNGNATQQYGPTSADRAFEIEAALWLDVRRGINRWQRRGNGRRSRRLGQNLVFGIDARGSGFRRILGLWRLFLHLRGLIIGLRDGLRRACPELRQTIFDSFQISLERLNPVLERAEGDECKNDDAKDNQADNIQPQFLLKSISPFPYRPNEAGTIPRAEPVEE